MPKPIVQKLGPEPYALFLQQAFRNFSPATTVFKYISTISLTFIRVVSLLFSVPVVIGN